MAKFVDSVAAATPAWLVAWARAWFTSTPEIPRVERNAAIPPEDHRNRPSESLFPAAVAHFLDAGCRSGNSEKVIHGRV